MLDVWGEGAAMQGWAREVRIGAAREFGARHYRGITAAELVTTAVRRLGLPVLVLGVAGGLGWWGWHATGRTTIPWQTAGIVLAIVVGLALVARLRLLVPVLVLGVAAGLGWLLWQAGTRWTTATVAGGLALVGVLLIVIAARRRSDYRRGAYVLWPAVAAALAFTAALGWLVRGSGLAVLLLVAAPASAVILAAAARLGRNSAMARYDLFD